METYITVSFWMMVVAMMLRLFIVSTANYPRVEEKKLGAEIVGILISAGFIVWAGILLFGANNV